MTPYTKDQLHHQLKILGINSTDTILIHSSMKAIGEVQNGADGVLDALIEYMAKGMLILPTHTWRNMHDSDFVYDPKTSPSCVGILTSMFFKRPNVYRSLHPTHSVAAVGDDAHDFVNGEETSLTPCPRSGCWGKLYDTNAKILFVGCSLKLNTIIHGVEEWNNVSNRLSGAPIALKRRTYNGSLMTHPMHSHHSHVGDISRQYDKIEPALLKHNIAHIGQFGNATTIVCNVKPMVELTSQLLLKNNNLFIDDTPIPKDWY